jgi:hypothetical protein
MGEATKYLDPFWIAVGMATLFSLLAGRHVRHDSARDVMWGVRFASYYKPGHKWLVMSFLAAGVALGAWLWELLA